MRSLRGPVAMRQQSSPMLGEDLSAASLQHCLESNGASYVNVRPETVGTGRQKGPRLDRWIEADLADGRRVLFQTEIKSWSAWAIGWETPGSRRASGGGRRLQTLVLGRAVGRRTPHVEAWLCRQSVGTYEAQLRCSGEGTNPVVNLLGGGQSGRWNG